MKYNVYIKGVAELPLFCAAAYAIYGENNVQPSWRNRKESQRNISTLRVYAANAMEIYAAASAIAKIPIGSEIEIFSNSKSIVAWINKGELPETSHYEPYVKLFKQMADDKCFPSIKATWVKKGECTRLDRVRTYALTR